MAALIHSLNSDGRLGIDRGAKEAELYAFMVAFLIYACLVLVQIVLLIVLGCSDMIEVTADDETVSDLLQKDDVLVCILLFLMSALFL